MICPILRQSKTQKFKSYKYENERASAEHWGFFMPE